MLDEQIGFILRQVSQRHAMIFARDIGADLTTAQWAAMSKLAETGPCSQNQLGRLTAMDVATIKGVIDRLTARGLTETSADPEDGRRLRVSLTRVGQQLVEKVASNALAISRETLAPLDPREREMLVACSTSCGDRSIRQKSYLLPSLYRAKPRSAQTLPTKPNVLFGAPVPFRSSAVTCVTISSTEAMTVSLQMRVSSVM